MNQNHQVSRWQNLAVMASVGTSLGYLFYSVAGLVMMQAYPSQDRWELVCVFAAIGLSAFSCAVGMVMTIRKSKLSYGLEGTVQIVFCLIFAMLALIGIVRDEEVDSSLVLKLIPLAASGLTAYLCFFSIALERKYATRGGSENQPEITE